MAKTVLALIMAALLGATAQAALAAEASVSMGQELFNDPTLGGSATPTTCGTCHPGGRGLEKAGTRDDLAAMVNTCVIRTLQGAKLDDDSPEMESLLLYIRSLGK